jgi:hypothetical protein
VEREEIAGHDEDTAVSFNSFTALATGPETSGACCTLNA